jgi:hypothetical protein
MDTGRASVRNVRSKCRCSYVLQFTFRHAVCCVLHRPPSQVIHCAALSFLKDSFASLSRKGSFSQLASKKKKRIQGFPSQGESKFFFKNPVWDVLESFRERKGEKCFKLTKAPLLPRKETRTRARGGIIVRHETSTVPQRPRPRGAPPY